MQVSRISIVGPTGSGKTFLSRQLHERLHLPLTELDELVAEICGKQGPDQKFVEAVRQVAGGERWIIDGHYRMVRDLIWHRSQVVIWLNHPLPVVFWRVFWRGVGKALARGQGERSPSAAGPEDAASGTGMRAGWGRRLSRVTKTIRERREFREIFRELDGKDCRVIELRSIGEAKELCRKLMSGESMLEMPRLAGAFVH